MLAALRILARWGRYTLAAGLVAGLLLPQLAVGLKPWLPHLAVFLLFLTAIRIGHRNALAGLKDIRSTVRIVLVYQLAMPLAALAVFWLFGLAHSAYAMAAALVLAAPALASSPNLSIMLNADPEPAFRTLILSTALLPLTMLPVFWASPHLGDFTLALAGSLRLLGAICMAILAGFFLRSRMPETTTKDHLVTLDGVIALALVVMVVGLMGAVSPLLSDSPSQVVIWLTLACILNLGMQVLAFFVLKRTTPTRQVVPYSVVAGNRNIALFLVTLPPAQAEPLMVFIGCYQVPMYLTPLLMRGLFKAHVL